jgi:glucose/arabinose dehydrogenase
MPLKQWGMAAAGLLVSALAGAQTLEKIWESDTSFPVPESVLFYAKTKTIFVSNIDGDASAKDGKGSVSKLDADGKNKVSEWARGLNAPKGMGFFGDELYVADVDVLRIYNLKTGALLDTVGIAGAVFLNDVTVDEAGNVYISDSRTGTIHLVNPKRNTQAFVTGLKGPNGLLWHNNLLYYADRGELWYRTVTGQLVKVATGMEASTDGIVPVDNGAFIVSCWSGVVYHVAAEGTVTTLLNLKDSKTNTADIGYDPATKTVYIPTFFKNKVMAYRFKP